jgi:3-oxoacyl-[acyl-carrier-protein] synthase III
MAGSKPPPHGPRYAQITGWGMAVPEKVVTNADLAHTIDTSDEWIVSHTGIKERRVASDRESTLSLAIRAAREALLVASLQPSRLDLVIVATVTPEHFFPSTASLVQDALGAAYAGAYDLSAGCSGFIYALTQAANAVRSGSAENVLVIGSETLSRIVDWTDRNTCVLFGDGAGAVVVSACAERCGVMASVLGSDGSGGDLLIVPGGGSHNPTSHEMVDRGDQFCKMNGREVYRFAATIMPRATEAAVQKAGWQLADLSLVIPHQANVRIIEAAIKRLNLPVDRFFINIDRYGNTSSASIPIALCEAITAGLVNQGDRMVLVGFGAGLTWAAVALEWGVPEPTKPRPWFIRWVAEIWFFLAGIRSVARRSERHFYDRVMGPEGADGVRGEIRQRTDRLRRKIAESAQPPTQPEPAKKLPAPPPTKPEPPSDDQGNPPSQ